MIDIIKFHKCINILTRAGAMLSNLPHIKKEDGDLNKRIEKFEQEYKILLEDLKDDHSQDAVPYLMGNKIKADIDRYAMTEGLEPEGKDDHDIDMDRHVFASKPKPKPDRWWVRNNGNALVFTTTPTPVPTSDALSGDAFKYLRPDLTIPNEGETIEIPEPPKPFIPLDSSHLMEMDLLNFRFKEIEKQNEELKKINHDQLHTFYGGKEISIKALLKKTSEFEKSNKILKRNNNTLYEEWEKAYKENQKMQKCLEQIIKDSLETHGDWRKSLAKECLASLDEVTNG